MQATRLPPLPRTRHHSSPAATPSNTRCRQMCKGARATCTLAACLVHDAAQHPLPPTASHIWRQQQPLVAQHSGVCDVRSLSLHTRYLTTCFVSAHACCNGMPLLPRAGLSVTASPGHPALATRSSAALCWPTGTRHECMCVHTTQHSLHHARSTAAARAGQHCARDTAGRVALHTLCVHSSVCLRAAHRCPSVPTAATPARSRAPGSAEHSTHGLLLPCLLAHSAQQSNSQLTPRVPLT
jgi:hypothetical protein